MAQTILDAVLDAALKEISDNANLMTACSAQPTTRTEAITTYMLADVVPTFQAEEDGDVSGRKVEVDAKAGETVTNSGTALFVALVDGTRLLAVTTCDSQGLTAASTVDFPAWDIEIADPA